MVPVCYRCTTVEPPSNWAGTRGVALAARNAFNVNEATPSPEPAQLISSPPAKPRLQVTSCEVPALFAKPYLLPREPSSLLLPTGFSLANTLSLPQNPP